MDWRRAGAGGGSVSAESQLQGAGRRGREQVMWHALYGGSRQQVAMGASGGVAAAAYLGSSRPPGCGKLSSDIQVAGRPSPVGRMATVAADVLKRLSSKWAPGNRLEPIGRDARWIGWEAAVCIAWTHGPGWAGWL